MAEYLIEGTVTAWPEGTVAIEVFADSEFFSKKTSEVDLSTGRYFLFLNAEPGEKVWLSFYGATLDMGSGSPGPGDRVTSQNIFGPFAIDDIGVLQ